ncbi:hypothetical protein [Salipiger sp. CCB-MM3]|uniref:hypothetical protein n=1 Tax=Salipiger sp. CCB-MM3 TaxID=1792508 RepID=UPI0012F98AE5|nr:hypothetical protein [Salipiger sp. CCB-MM3]
MTQDFFARTLPLLLRLSVILSLGAGAIAGILICSAIYATDKTFAALELAIASGALVLAVAAGKRAIFLFGQMHQLRTCGKCDLELLCRLCPLDELDFQAQDAWAGDKRVGRAAPARRSADEGRHQGGVTPRAHGSTSKHRAGFAASARTGLPQA